MDFFKRLTRKKVFAEGDVEETHLDRCMSTVDLIGLGVGSTLGAGLYVMSGQVANDVAGPAVILSFLVAGIASAFAAMSYAEFAARIPRAGSAYVYSYVTVGEFMAFFIGWNLVLEYIIGSASVARAWSGNFDAMIDYKISHFFNTTLPMRVQELSEYPDFFAFGITMFITILLIMGVKESTRVNNVFTCVNLLVVAYIAICGLFKLDWHNWDLSKEADDIPPNFGSGGFMPFGFSGVMAGAATCFYGFVGFDAVATTGEETKNPQRAIPIAIGVSLLIIFFAYFVVSGVLTLMCPYYLIDRNSPLPFIFERVGWGVARYIISVGSLCALSTSLLGGMFPLPRILYAMGSDGLIFRFMAKVHPRWKTPIAGTLISGTLAGTMAMMFNLKELLDMMSIGTLLAYTLVGLCVLILRYEPDSNLQGHLRGDSGVSPAFKSDDANFASLTLDNQWQPFHWSMLIQRSSSEPTSVTSRITKIFIVLKCVAIIQFALTAIFAEEYVMDLEPLAVTSIAFSLLVFVVCIVVIAIQPMSSTKLPFRVLLVPLTPALSCLINIYLMLKLSPMTWLRFGIWLVVGFVLYFGYGIRHSSATIKHETVNSSNSNSSSSPLAPRLSTPLLDGLPPKKKQEHLSLSSSVASTRHKR